jgi:CDP-diacylglycerol--serine O-phosphatidyltransferase
MSKLPKEFQFTDVSDYGRPIAIKIASLFVKTAFTPIHMTLLFVISGCIAIFCIYQSYFIAAAFFLVLKSILDAADGELARLKETPSYSGRYLDSISDILLNAVIIYTIWTITESSGWLAIIAFLGLQLQGTLYNYYYVILRNKCLGGDTTSRVFEVKTPIALEGESQKHVTILFKIYKALYGGFDKVVYSLDPKAYKAKAFPSWFMCALSIYGLGFQLLLIGIMLVFGLKTFIIPIFIGLTSFIIVFIGIRKTFLT